MVEIRPERQTDEDAVREVNRLAFGQEHEGRIVDAIRAASAVTLALVAVADDGDVVGHILFSPLTVGAERGAGLAPMAVRPLFQRQGIGSRLVREGLQRLRAQGCPFVVVIGHPAFYPRFGFVPAGNHGLTCDWDVPADVFMVHILDPSVEPRLQGRATYRAEFSTVG